MHEKRLVDRLNNYWDRLKGDASFPQYERLNAAALSDIWDRCILLEVDKSPSKSTALYTYQHMGDKIIKTYGTDLTGHYVNVHMHNFPGWQVLQSVDKVILSPEVKTSTGTFVNEDDRLVKYRACVMPFGIKEKITHALVGLSWKLF